MINNKQDISCSCSKSEDVFYTEEELNKLKKLKNEELIKLYQEGNKGIEDILVSKNKNLIYYIIKKEKLFSKSAMDEEDLFQEGVLGLKKAADRFEFGLGSFTTYAYHWINQQMRRSIADSGFLIRIPVYVQERLSKIKKLERFYSKEELLEKICEECECGENTAKRYLEILENEYSIASLNKCLNHVEDTFLMDMISGNVVGSPQKKLELEELHEAIEKALEKVCKNLKEIKIMKQRYGLEGGEPQTLEVIAHKNRVTRERIRQIQKKIEGRLRLYLKEYEGYHFDFVK